MGQTTDGTGAADGILLIRMLGSIENDEDGMVVDTLLGDMVGTDENALLGNTVGTDENALLGRELGCTVDVGDPLGTSVSRADGDPLGDKLDKPEGIIVGLGVLSCGACVGAGFSTISSNISSALIR